MVVRMIGVNSSPLESLITSGKPGMISYMRWCHCDNIGKLSWFSSSHVDSNANDERSVTLLPVDVCHHGGTLSCLNHSTFPNLQDKIWNGKPGCEASMEHGFLRDPATYHVL